MEVKRMIIKEKIKEAMNYRLGKLEPKFFRRWEELENLKIEFNYQYDVKFSKIIQSIYDGDDKKEVNNNKSIFNGTNPYTSYTVDDYNYGVNGISTSNDKMNLLSNTSNSKIINQSYCNTSINVSNFDLNKESDKKYIKVKQRMENILSPNIYTNPGTSYHINNITNETQSKSKSRQCQRSKDSIFRLKEEEKRQILNKIAYIPIESHCLNETISYKFKKNHKKEENNEKNQFLPNFNTVLASDGVYKRNIIDRVYSNVKDMSISKSLSKFYPSKGFTSNRLNSQIRKDKSENYNNLNNTLSNFSLKNNSSYSKDKDRQLTNIRTPYTTGKNCKIREDRDKLYSNFKKNHKRSSITNTKSDKILLSTKKKHKNSDISNKANEKQLKNGKNSELISRIDLRLMNNSIPIDLSIKAKEEELLKIKQRLEMEEIKRKQLEEELIKMKIFEFDDRGSLYLNHEVETKENIDFSNENQLTRNDNINDNIDEMTRKLKIFKEEERERNEKKRKEEELKNELEKKRLEELNEKQMREEEEEKRQIEERRMKEEEEKRRREKEKAEEEERIKNERIRLFKQKQEEMRRKQMELEEEELEREREEEIEKERIKEQLLKIEEDKIDRYQKYEEQQLMREIKSRMITDEDENRSEKDEEEEERNDTLTSEEIVENDRKSVVDDNKKEDFKKIEIEGINKKVNNCKRISILNNSIQITINNLLEKYDVYLKVSI